MAGVDAVRSEQVRSAEIVAALCLASDLAMGLPLEHGLSSALVAMRLGELLGIDAETASDAYYACLLFHPGCTADAEIAMELFGSDHALLTEFVPVMFGSRRETMAGVMRGLATPGATRLVRVGQIVGKLPRAARTYKSHTVAACQVAEMLSARLGVRPSVRALFARLTERWDGKGEPGLTKGDELPPALRIAHVARDAALQHMLGGELRGARVVRQRDGRAFDPAVANCLADHASAILSIDVGASVWQAVLDAEPRPRNLLEGGAIDEALAAVGDFADLASPYLVGHSAGVAELARAVARRSRWADVDVVAVHRAALVHDVGRVAVPVRIWQRPASLTADDWERVRLHAYHSERVLSRSPFLAELAAIGSYHHERLDGSGYHRGVPGAALSHLTRLLAVCDAYHAMTEPRPHRAALTPEQAAAQLMEAAHAGRLDVDAVGAVVEAAGQPRPRLERPAGLTEREAQVVGLLARGYQTKQIGRALGISSKTADRHVQNAYGKIGVSTRAAAALFAMEHGLTMWGELPMGPPSARP
jgi:HD-GYP domain-containing protein (c-di-GMP phosphodiesterase class II)